MLGGKKHLYVIIGGLVVGVAAVLMVYFIMITTGVIQTTKNDLVITTANAEKIYDGTALTCEEFEILEGKLPKGYTVKAVFTGSMTDAGEAENSATAIVYDSEGADVTSKYNITYSYGKLTVLPRTLQYFSQNSAKYYDGTALTANHVEHGGGELVAGHTCEIEAYGERIEIGESEMHCNWTVKDDAGNDVSHNYNVEYTPGVLTVKPVLLSFYSNDIEKIYDGTPLRPTHYEMLGGTLLPGHTMNVVLKGERTDVGITESILFVTVVNSAGMDVSSYYEVSYSPGKVIVTGRPITIQTASDEKIYDGEVLTNDGWEHIEGDLLPGHTVEATVAGRRTKVGQENNIAGVTVTDASGADVTRNYAITFAYGQLIVKGIPVNVYSFDAEKEYDGTPLTQPRTPEHTGDLLPGHMFIAEAVGSQTEVGKSYNFIKASVIDEAGEDVTGYYELIFNHGILTVLEPESERNSDEYAVINSSTGGDIYLRENSYGNYMSGVWYGQKQKFDSSGTISPLYFASSAFAEDQTLTRGTLSIKLWRSISTYMTAYYTTTYTADPSDDVKPVAEFVKDEPYMLDMVFYEYSEDTIGRYSINPDYRSVETKYANFVRQNYLDVDKGIKEELERIASENGLSANSSTLVQDILDYVRNAADYKVGVKVPAGEDPILYFLEDGKEGKCTDFAGAATLLFRLFGVPARITTGYLVADAKPNVDITVKGANAHAWVEIYVNGIGWVCVDPTPDDGGARGGESILVKPNDIYKYWTKDSGSLTHPGTLYNENGIVNAIKERLELTSSDTVVIERDIESDTLRDPGLSDAYVKAFKVYLNGELIYEYASGKEITNTYDLRFSYDYGILKYYKYRITVSTLGSLSKEYDGVALDFDASMFDISWRVESEADPDVSKNDFDLSAKIALPGAIVDAGRRYIGISDLNINSAIPSDLYHVVYSYAYAEVTRRSTTISVDENGEYVASDLVYGHTLAHCSINFEYNSFDVIITDANGEDVTDNYTFVLDIY